MNNSSKSPLQRYVSTVKQVRMSFARDIPCGWYAKYVLRPISFLITPIFLHLGLSANQVTLLGGLLGIISLGFIACASYKLWLVGCALFLFSLLFDYADGHVARMTDSATYFGKFLDGLVDTFLLTFLPICLSWRCYARSQVLEWLIWGVTIAFVYLIAVFIQARFSFYRNWIKIDCLEGRIANLQEVDLNFLPRIMAGNIIFNYLIFTFPIAAIFDFCEYFLIGLGLVSIIWGIEFISRFLYSASKILVIHRRSKHHVVETNYE